MDRLKENNFISQECKDNTKYYLGNSIRFCLENSVGLNESKLAKVFKDKLLQFGLYAVCCSTFAHTGATNILLEIYIDSSRSEPSLVSMCCNDKNAIEKELYDKILKIWHEALDELKIERPIVTPNIVIGDFYHVAANVYFSVFSSEIDRMVKQKFSIFNVSVRFKRNFNRGKHYYLIFENNFVLQIAKKLGTVKKITDEIYRFCLENDMLSIFENCRPEPQLDTRSSIRKSGRTMEIIRENPEFPEL